MNENESEDWRKVTPEELALVRSCGPNERCVILRGTFVKATIPRIEAMFEAAFKTAFESARRYRRRRRPEGLDDGRNLRARLGQAYRPRRERRRAHGNGLRRNPRSGVALMPGVRRAGPDRYLPPEVFERFMDACEQAQRHGLYVKRPRTHGDPWTLQRAGRPIIEGSLEAVEERLADLGRGGYPEIQDASRRTPPPNLRFAETEDSL